MESAMTAIEVTGHVDENQRLTLDAPLSIKGPKRVRVIILYDVDEEWNEAEWLRAIANNEAFASLHEPEEEIYTLEDGTPFHDET